MKSKYIKYPYLYSLGKSSRNFMFSEVKRNQTNAGVVCARQKDTFRSNDTHATRKRRDFGVESAARTFCVYCLIQLQFGDRCIWNITISEASTTHAS